MRYFLSQVYFYRYKWVNKWSGGIFVANLYTSAHESINTKYVPINKRIWEGLYQWRDIFGDETNSSSHSPIQYNNIWFLDINPGNIICHKKCNILSHYKIGKITFCIHDICLFNFGRFFNVSGRNIHRKIGSGSNRYH